MAQELQVRKVTMFKHGVAHFTLEGEIEGTGTMPLDFKQREMNDVLKSLLAVDMSGGFVSSIAYDADRDIGKMLEDVAVDVSSKDSFTSLLDNFRGAGVDLEVAGLDIARGKIMGIQEYTSWIGEHETRKPALVLLDDAGTIRQFAFADIKSFVLRDEKLRGDLAFYLDTVISGKKKDTKRIFIRCEGEGRRKLVATYIIESPVWKTSYRVIIPADAKETKCFLSGWCIVENTTENDWNEIALSLVAGQPISFVCPIYPPIHVTRPRVEPPRAAQVGPAAIEDEMEDRMFEVAESEPMMEMRSAARPKAMSRALGGAPGGPASMFAAAPAPAPPPSQAFREQAKQATTVSTKDMGELFEYRIAKPVTIKRKKSALVPIVSEDIDGKRLLHFEAGQHPTSPMACLEITNTSPLTLESGPMTVMFDDDLAGEAMLPFLNRDETRLVSYALEQGVVITTETKSENHAVHRVLFHGGYSYEYYNRERATTYKIVNKTTRDHVLYVDHPKSSGYEVVETTPLPKDTPSFHRFSISLAAKKNVQLVVREREETYTSVKITDLNKDALWQKVTLYTKHGWIGKEQETTLQAVSDVLETLRGIVKNLEERKRELDAIVSEQERLRQNIKTMGTSQAEMTLRGTYVQKLADQETRLDAIRQEVARLDEEAAKASERLAKLVKELEA